MINWKVRSRNKLWLTSLFSQTVIMIQAVVAGLVALGAINMDLAQVDTWIKVVGGMFNAVLLYLSFLGIVQDPTTKGKGDSIQAMQYNEPKE
ncbi:phage holin [Priestia megaterium]|uniref:phage holin n=1 Tax=Priestia megaterium TaxID=1404 RepID=UPI00211CCA27|nr:phage holin [Priestia megaterium]